MLYLPRWCHELATLMVGKKPAFYIAKTEGGKGRSIRFIEDGQPGELATTNPSTVSLTLSPGSSRVTVQHVTSLLGGCFCL